MADTARQELEWIASEFRDELERMTPADPGYATFAQAAEQAERMAQSEHPAAMLEAMRERGPARLH